MTCQISPLYSYCVTQIWHFRDLGFCFNANIYKEKFQSYKRSRVIASGGIKDVRNFTLSQNVTFIK